MFASLTGTDPVTDDLVLIDFDYARPISNIYKRTEDIYHVIDVMVMMNRQMEFFLPNYTPFPGYASECPSEVVKEDPIKITGLSADRVVELENVMTELAGLYTSIRNDNPPYEELRGFLKKAIDLF